MKHLLRTIVLSSLLFFLLVFLGIKYHWISLLKNEDSGQKNTFQIPAKVTSNNYKSPQLLSEQDHNFQPEIVNRSEKTLLLANMTKSQVIESCKSLFDKMNDGKSQKELFIGNCVVSNYQESYRKTGTSANKQQ